MAQIQFTLALLILLNCVSATAQVALPSIECQEIIIGQLRAGLFVSAEANNPSLTFLPGVPSRVSLEIAVNGQNEIPNTTAGTYLGTDPCSLRTGTFSTTFNIPIALTVVGTGMQRTYTVSVSD